MSGVPAVADEATHRKVLMYLGLLPRFLVGFT